MLPKHFFTAILLVFVSVFFVPTLFMLGVSTVVTAVEVGIMLLTANIWYFVGVASGEIDRLDMVFEDEKYQARLRCVAAQRVFLCMVVYAVLWVLTEALWHNSGLSGNVALVASTMIFVKIQLAS